jgi:hypothetical protein
MTSIASPKLHASVLSTNTNSTKNSSPTSIKKEVNNNTPRTSNGNSSKPTIIQKKVPIQNSPIKRKSRVLSSSSDDSDDDNQSLVRKINFYPAYFFFRFTYLFSCSFSFLNFYTHYACSAHSRICF